jgi:amino acid efflux transporter
MRQLLTAIAVAGLLLIVLYGLRLVSAAALVAVPTALFLSVYLGAMAAAVRLLRGPARLAAVPGALAVTVMLGFCGWALALPAVIALASGCRAWAAARRRRRVRCLPVVGDSVVGDSVVGSTVPPLGQYSPPERDRNCSSTRYRRSAA